MIVSLFLRTLILLIQKFQFQLLAETPIKALVVAIDTTSYIHTNAYTKVYDERSNYSSTTYSLSLQTGGTFWNDVAPLS